MVEGKKVVFIPSGDECMVAKVNKDFSIVVDIETGQDIVVTEDEYCMYEPV